MWEVGDWHLCVTPSVRFSLCWGLGGHIFILAYLLKKVVATIQLAEPNYLAGAVVQR